MVLIGGISEGSLNRRFFAAVEQLATGSVADIRNDNTRNGGPGNYRAGDGSMHGSATDNISLKFTAFEIASLPFYSQDTENDPPASVLALRELAANSDALLIVTPEYNRSIPGVLKNALDWGSRPAGKNIWAGMPTAIMGASPGAIGTFGAQQHLRNVCSFLDMPVMNQPTVYFNASTGMTDANGKVGAGGDRLTDDAAKFLRTFLAAFEKWIALFRNR